MCVEGNRILDGAAPLDLHIYDLIQARAAMKLNKGVALDGIPMEVYRAFPWLCTLHVYHLFKTRLKCEFVLLIYVRVSGSPTKERTTSSPPMLLPW